MEYREFPELPGYRIGSDGSVWSRWQPGGQGKPSKIGSEWRRLNTSIDEAGRPRVCLKGSQKYRVCRLVLIAFVGDMPGMEACHIDGNPSNNNLANLRWGTAKENAADRRNHGRDRLGESHHNAKLTSEDVATAKNLRVSGMTLKEIGIRLGVSTAQIHNIVSGKQRKEAV